MRPVFTFKVRIQTAGRASLAALALALISTAGHAQDAVPADSANVPDLVANAMPAVMNGVMANEAVADDSQRISDAAVISSDLASDGAPLDDQVLSRQRGGRAGMVMVAATPQLMGGANGVTLWDEIAPPAPVPAIPVDAASRSTQENVASFTRR
jgi:hypothetical protein